MSMPREKAWCVSPRRDACAASTTGDALSCASCNSVGRQSALQAPKKQPAMLLRDAAHRVLHHCTHHRRWQSPRSNGAFLSNQSQSIASAITRAVHGEFRPTPRGAKRHRAVKKCNGARHSAGHMDVPAPVGELAARHALERARRGWGSGAPGAGRGRRTRRAILQQQQRAAAVWRNGVAPVAASGCCCRRC